MIGIIVMIADVLTKQFILSGYILNERDVLDLTSFFRIVLIWNYGVSFGILNNGHSGNAHLLVLIALIIIACLTRWLWRTHSKWQANSLGLIIGGALGNVVDRAQHGAVTDFLDFFLGAYHWPAFNLADAAVSTGVLLLIAESFLADKTNENKPR